MNSTSNWEFIDKNSLIVSIPEPLKAITPGQFSAFYQERFYIYLCGKLPIPNIDPNSKNSSFLTLTFKRVMQISIVEARKQF